MGGLGLVWLADPRVAQLWINTALLAAGACAMALPVGALLAVLLFKTDVPGRTLATWLMVGLLFVPLYLVTGAWDAGFGIQGWHTLVSNPHLAHQPWLAGWRAAVWVHAMAAVPWVVLIIGAGLWTVEAELEEDALTFMRPWRVLWHVSLRRAAPAIGLAAVWIATVVLTEISVTDFFQVRTFAEEVYTQAALGLGISIAPPTGAEGAGLGHAASSRIGMWSGIALSAALGVALLAATMRLLARIVHAPHAARWHWRLQGARWPMASVLAAMLLLTVGMPVASLVYKAGVSVAAHEGSRVRAWRLATFVGQVLAAPGKFAGEINLSAEIGLSAALAAVGIAIPLVWSLCPASVPQGGGQVRVRWRWSILLLVALCLTIPGPLLGLGVIRLLNQSSESPLAWLAALYDSNFAPWLVQVIRGLPIAVLILWPALASIPQAQLDAAAMDGSGRWGTLLWIVLPQRWGAVAAAWLMAASVAVGELAATVLVMPPQVGSTALSIQIFQLLHYGVDDRVAAISLVMATGVALISGIAGLLWKRMDGWMRTR